MNSIEKSIQFSRLIDLKFGTDRGSKKRAAKTLGVNYSYLINMRSGNLYVPQKHIDALLELPDYKMSPEEAFVVINGAGDTRVSVVIPAPIVAFLDGVAVQRGYGDALTQDNAESVINHVLAVAQFNLTGEDPFEAASDEENPLA